MRKIKFLIMTLSLMGFATSAQTIKTKPENSKEQIEKNIKVLFVLTSHDQLGNTGKKTGFWLEEFAGPYYYLLDNGVKIAVASPKGGKAPIDPRSEAEASQTEATRRFNKDKVLQNLVNNTLKLKDVKAEDYDAVFFPGGHGPLWDLAEDTNSIALIEDFYNNNKPVAAVCHGPAVFKQTKNADGTPLINGKKVTGFTNEEENAAHLNSVVPFLLEEMLKNNGGIYSNKAKWSAYAVEDGLLITGQNPASSILVAELLLKKLE